MSLSVRSWAQVVPHARSTDLDVGLAAQVADPLWFILRQWQVGELNGQDAGSAVAVDLSASWSTFTRYRADGVAPSTAATSAPVARLDRAGWLLETLVEREPVFRQDGRGTPWTAAVRAGRSLAHALEGAGLLALATAMAAHPSTTFRADPVADTVEGEHDTRYRRLLAGAAIDGARVVALIDGSGLPADLSAGVDGATLDGVLRSWREAMDRDWGIALPGSSLSPAWVADRLEYAFSVAAPPLPGDSAERVLTATAYDGKGLAWYSLDLAAGGSLGAAGDGSADTVGTRVRTLLPTPLSFPGMPADRFWELEDAAVALGRLGAGPTDLARMLALDFAVVYGPEWYLAPVEVPVGCVARVDWVVVRDTFGIATVVGTSATSAGDGLGRQFQPSLAGGAPGDDGDIPLLVVLPSALDPLTSDAREDVALQRDEVANLAWAIERRVMGPSGREVDRPWFRTEFALPPEESVAQHEFVWRLATPVAATWSPMVTVATVDGPRLRRAQLLATSTLQLRRSVSLLLADLGDLHQEEVTHAGLQLRVVERLARSSDGGTVAWRGRERNPWRGEASSGLTFDAASPATS
jgi:hypothetical protein